MDAASIPKHNEELTEIVDADGNQEDRILKLHNLIEQNIVVDQMLETKTFGASVNAIDSLLTKSQNLFAVQDVRSMNSTEFVLDTELLRRNHELMGKVIQYNTNFTDEMFGSTFTNFVNKDGEEDWSTLAKFIFNLSNSVFLGTSMLPFLEMEQAKVKAPKTRAHRKSKILAEEKRPMKSDQLERVDGTSDMAGKFLKRIKNYWNQRQKPFPLYMEIVDRNDFMGSVINAMQVAALAKENVISLIKGDDGFPQIRPSNSKKPPYGDGYHVISTLSSGFCQNLSNIYDTSDAVMPSEDNS